MTVSGNQSLKRIAAYLFIGDQTLQTDMTVRQNEEKGRHRYLSIFLFIDNQMPWVSKSVCQNGGASRYFYSSISLFIDNQMTQINMSVRQVRGASLYLSQLNDYLKRDYPPNVHSCGTHAMDENTGVSKCAWKEIANLTQNIQQFTCEDVADNNNKWNDIMHQKCDYRTIDSVSESMNQSRGLFAMFRSQSDSKIQI